MKIRTVEMDYDQVAALPRPARRRPLRPNLLLRAAVRLGSVPDLAATRFSFTRERMEEAGPGPYLILMNHSSFIDLKIAFRLLFPLPFCIVCTSDGFVGRELLMRHLGCIPTRKFVGDPGLVSDMRYAVEKLRTSVLMYPEASYTFDGCPTPLPRGLGRLLKLLKVPVLTITTRGAFARDPLYNGLQKRRVAVSARLRCLLTAQEVEEQTVEQLDAALDAAFSFDNFAWQYENGVRVTEPFRADGLDRILYKCARCGAEGQMEGKGELLTCHSCGSSYRLTELGRLQALQGPTEFEHIPDWYRWQRQQVRQELEQGSYRFAARVKIGMMVDYKAIYMVGEGELVQDGGGFTLTGCGGRLAYRQKPQASYGLYADYYWYEIGDVICIGDKKQLYYCFPQGKDPVAKARLAAEELYKLARPAPALQRG